MKSLSGWTARSSSTCRRRRTPQSTVRRREPRQLLPGLLRRLVHSTDHDLRQVDFPGYDNAERKGSDGIIESDAPTAWIPDGKSFWEFGVNKNPQVKAEKDYAARVASVPAAERAQAPF